MSNQITGKEDVVVAILTDILSALNDIKYEMSGYNEKTRVIIFKHACLVWVISDNYLFDKSQGLV